MTGDKGWHLVKRKELNDESRIEADLFNRIIGMMVPDVVVQPRVALLQAVKLRTVSVRLTLVKGWIHIQTTRSTQFYSSC